MLLLEPGSDSWPDDSGEASCEDCVKFADYGLVWSSLAEVAVVCCWKEAWETAERWAYSGQGTGRNAC